MRLLVLFDETSRLGEVELLARFGRQTDVRDEVAVVTAEKSTFVLLCHQILLLLERCGDLFRSNTCSGATVARSSLDSPQLAARDLIRVASCKNSEA